MGELSQNGGCLTTDVRDAHCLAEAIGTLLQDEVKCRALSREAYERPLRSWAELLDGIKASPGKTMIYLDVTSACQSVLNTGVKRMQRGLHDFLKMRVDYTPVCWQSARRGYRTLTATDLANLEQTSRQEVKGLGVYDIFSPGLISDWLHFFRDADKMLRWPQNLTDEDVVLIPDLLWDNRGAYWSRLGVTPAKCVGIFHDAIALRRPEQSGI